MGRTANGHPGYPFVSLRSCIRWPSNPLSALPVLSSSQERPHSGQSGPTPTRSLGRSERVASDQDVAASVGAVAPWLANPGGYTRPVLKFGVVALGVTDVQRAAEFWSAALGYELREDGLGGWANVLTSPGETGMAIALQLSQTPPPARPRLHFDLHVTDASEQEAEASRLVSLGARRVDWDSYPEDPDFIVLEDPDGNRFCIVDLSHEHR